MKDIILIFPLLALMVAYYYFMCCVDKFISTEEALCEAEEFVNKDMLLFKGEAELIDVCEDNGVRFDLIESPCLPRFCCYRIVLGVSDNDLDNLLICKASKRFDPFVRTVAKCNAQVYHEIFSCEEVDAVVTNSIEISAILREWEVIK
ncbi:MAG: hypothetical protein EOM59_06995 [Clostridia bacterium]|nr:hypothetical protein [Clostridia bacterium]